METFDADLEEVVGAIQVELKRLIETQADMSQFAKLDDVIDGAGERITGSLALLSAEGGVVLKTMLRQTEQAASFAKLASTGVAAMAIIAIVPLMLLIIRTLMGVLARLQGNMVALADGTLDIDIVDADRHDELGEMARAVLVFRDNAVERARLEGTQKEETAARLAREERLRSLIASFESSIGDVVSGIDGAASQMSETAATLTGVADDTRGRTSSAAAASTEASTNVQTVASSAEELSASIGEIGQQVTRATDVVAQASARAAKSNTDVAELATAAQRIGEVVTLIQDIAEQTNLLALNATIEAARAGEAGRGFAVVASEVKALATQTAKATEEIANQIEGIQGSTDGAVEAIGEITRIMDEVNAITGSIAAAVEEQSSATQEISRSIQEAAAGTEDVARNVEGISGAVDETAQSAGYMQNAAQDLTDRAAALRTQVGDFLKNVAAA